MRSLLFYIFCFCTSLSFAQSTYFDKKVVIDANFIGRMSFISDRMENLFSENSHYKLTSSGGRLEAYRNYDFGLSSTVTLLSKKSVSFGVNFMYYRFDAIRGDFYYDNYYEAITRTEDLSFNSFTIMPLLSYTAEDIIKPIGLTHEFGIGYMKSTSVDKEYHYYNYDGQMTTDTARYYPIKGITKGVVVCYGLKLYKPITENLLFNIGMRYALTFGNDEIQNPAKAMPNGDYFSRAEVNDVARKCLNRNFINLSFGFSFLL